MNKKAAYVLTGGSVSSMPAGDDIRKGEGRFLIGICLFVLFIIAVAIVVVLLAEAQNQDWREQGYELALENEGLIKIEEACSYCDTEGGEENWESERDYYAEDMIGGEDIPCQYQ